MQPKLLSIFCSDSILYEEALRQLAEDFKVRAGRELGKYGFFQYPCEIGHLSFRSAHSLSVFSVMDRYGFKEVQWRGYDRHKSFAKLRKIETFKVDHVPDEFEDQLVQALAQDAPLQPI